MLNNLLKDPLANGLAVIVLVSLAMALIGSLVIALRDSPVSTGKNGYTVLLLLFTLLGLPAAFDLLGTRGWPVVLALVVFLALAFTLIMPLWQMAGKTSHPLVANWQRWAIPVLALGGLAVAGYLAFVESTNTSPLCGPVGHCGEVQNSPYAVLFGTLPVGVLGFAGYAAILVLWLVGQSLPDPLKKTGALIIWGFCLFGVIFSAYLTFLEPFVIGATCMWCISSAVVMNVLLWLSTPPAQKALAIDLDA